MKGLKNIEKEDDKEAGMKRREKHLADIRKAKNGKEL